MGASSSAATRQHAAETPEMRRSWPGSRELAGGRDRANPAEEAEGSRTGCAASQMVASLAGGEQNGGDGRRGRRRRLPRACGLPAAYFRRGKRGDGGGSGCDLRFVWGGPERGARVGGAAGDCGVAVGRREGGFLRGRFTEKSSEFSVILNRSNIAGRTGLRVLFTDLGGAFLQKRHRRVCWPSDRRRTAGIAQL